VSEEKQKSFEVAMDRFGGALSVERIHPVTAAGFQEILGLLRGILKSPRLGNNDVYCDWVDNPRFNALATSYKNDEFIGIFAGTVIETYNHFYTYLADPTTLPTIGNSQNEILDEKSLRSLNGTEQFKLARAPRDPVRLSAAQSLAWGAILFLFFHENAHLELCHLRLLREEADTVDYLEIPSVSLTEKEARLRVLLELDADQCAATNSWRQWRAFWHRNAFPGLRSLTAELSWSISTAMLFRIMDGLMAGSARPTYSTHPPPLIRYIHVTMLATDPERPQYVGSENVGYEGLENVFAWWKANRLPTSSGDHGVTENAATELNGLRRELANNFSERLNEFQKERRLERKGQLPS
jgi:hypothetical protein